MVLLQRNRLTKNKAFRKAWRPDRGNDMRLLRLLIITVGFFIFRIMSIADAQEDAANNLYLIDEFQSGFHYYEIKEDKVLLYSSIVFDNTGETEKRVKIHAEAGGDYRSGLLKSKQVDCYIADKHLLGEPFASANNPFVPYEEGRSQIMIIPADERFLVYVVYVGELGSDTVKSHKDAPKITRVEILE